MVLSKDRDRLDKVGPCTLELISKGAKTLDGKRQSLHQLAQQAGQPPAEDRCGLLSYVEYKTIKYKQIGELQQAQN